MKLKFFGKSVEIRAGTAVIAVSILVILGCLIGYIFFRDVGDIIIEAGPSEQEITADGTSTYKTGLASDGTGSGTAAGISEKAAGENGAAADTEAGADSNKKDQIKIYVVGCVNRPGIVTIEKGQLIDDAVRLAGGLTGEADAGSINMVYSLNENAMLHIKSRKDLETETKITGGQLQKSNMPATDGMPLGRGADIITGTGEGAAVTAGTDSGNTAGNGHNAKVNINTAGTDELDTLPGIGEATARDIIAYREKNGPFGRIEDIMKVPRIKQNRFESIKDYITVD